MSLAILNDNVGALDIGGFMCGASCEASDNGTAFDFISGAYGGVFALDTMITVEVVEVPVSEQLEDVLVDLQQLGGNSGATRALNRLLERGDLTNTRRVKRVLRVNKIAIKRSNRRGRIGDETAAELTATLQGLIDSL